MMTSIDWQVGDRAYISGHPTSGHLSHGDIVHVKMVRKYGPEFGVHGVLLNAEDRKPLRLRRPGEVIPAGTKLGWLRNDGQLVEFVCNGRSSSDLDTTHVIISLPVDEKRQKMLDRIEAIEHEAAELRKALD